MLFSQWSSCVGLGGRSWGTEGCRIDSLEEAMDGQIMRPADYILAYLCFCTMGHGSSRIHKRSGNHCSESLCRVWCLF